MGSKWAQSGHLLPAPVAAGGVAGGFILHLGLVHVVAHREGGCQHNALPVVPCIRSFIRLLINTLKNECVHSCIYSRIRPARRGAGKGQEGPRPRLGDDEGGHAHHDGGPAVHQRRPQHEAEVRHLAERDGGQLEGGGAAQLGARRLALQQALDVADLRPDRVGSDRIESDHIITVFGSDRVRSIQIRSSVRVRALVL